jgi:hypothetical protein
MRSKRTHWAAHVAAWQSSGVSQAAYCRRHGLSLGSFGYWRRQLRTDRDEPDAGVPEARALLPIHMAPMATSPLSSWGVEVCLSNGLRVRLPGLDDAASVVSLVRALSSC